MSRYPFKNLILGLVGAIVGGILGIFVFKWLISQGMYGAVIPGAFVGLGFGLAARAKRLEFGVLSGFMGLVAILLAEWYSLVPEKSFAEFLIWYGAEGSYTWVLLAIGIVMAFWFGIGRENRTKPRPEKND